MSVKIVLADDHAVFRKGLRALLENAEGFEIICETGTGLETVEKVLALKPDLLILDINMPGLTGPRVAEKVLMVLKDLPIVVLTMHESESYMREMLHIGVRGFVLKRSAPEVLFQAIEQVLRGVEYIDPVLQDKREKTEVVFVGDAVKKERLQLLTEREQEVLINLAYGLTNSEIADKLHLSRRTVETHRNNLTAKLSLKTRTELVRFALENNLLNIENCMD